MVLPRVKWEHGGKATASDAIQYRYLKTHLCVYTSVFVKSDCGSQSSLHNMGPGAMTQIIRSGSKYL